MSVVASTLPSLRKKVFSILGGIAPLSLAEKWDNVGVLIDVLEEPSVSPLVVFFTNDLTEKVLAEAIEKNANVIVSYHPTPFRSMKRFEANDVTARIVLSCASRGISVYSPHTAMDNAPNGLNDWLISGLGEGSVQPVVPNRDTPEAGNGRILALSQPTPLMDIITRTKAHLGLAHVRLAMPSTMLPGAGGARNAAAVSAAAIGGVVNSVAVCAGSGSSVLGGVAADVYVTGEMSHHEVLAANAAGVSVILTDHSNTERGFLPVLAERVGAALKEQGEAEGSVVLLVSEVDSDPLNVL